jgi:hypothetical protein
MSTVKYRRILIIALFLSAGASTLAHARGAPAHSVFHGAGTAVQERSSSRILFEAAQNLWAGIRDFYWGPPPPPHGGDGPSHREGPGVCPHGHM